MVIWHDGFVPPTHHLKQKEMSKKEKRYNFTDPYYDTTKEDDYELLMEFDRFLASGSVSLEEQIHEFLCSVEWRVFRGYVKREE